MLESHLDAIREALAYGSEIRLDLNNGIVLRVEQYTPNEIEINVFFYPPERRIRGRWLGDPLFDVDYCCANIWFRYNHSIQGWDRTIELAAKTLTESELVRYRGLIVYFLAILQNFDPVYNPDWNIETFTVSGEYGSPERERYNKLSDDVFAYFNDKPYELEMGNKPYDTKGRATHSFYLTPDETKAIEDVVS